MLRLTNNKRLNQMPTIFNPKTAKAKMLLGLFIALTFSLTACNNSTETTLTPTTNASVGVTMVPSLILPQATPTLTPLANNTPDGTIISQKLLNTRNKVEYYGIVYSSDGLRVTGYIAKPVGAGPFPAIVYNHGGIAETVAPQEFVGFAEGGYVVIATNYRGNGGSEGHEDLGGKDPDDVLNALVAIRSQPYVATNRIFMIGGSRGGLETLLAMERIANPSWIRAIIAYYPPTDMYKLYDHFNQIADKPEIIVNALKILKCTPAECDAAYRLRSPVFFADKIQSPVLLLHGDADTLVPYEHTTFMYEALLKAGKTVEMHIYPGYGHGFFPGDWTDPNARTLAWLQKYDLK